MKRIRLSSGGWSHEPVMRAEGFLEHLRGLRMLDPGSAMLLDRSSVHAVGISQPFRAVGLSDDYVVMDVRIVRPWTAVRFRGCSYVVELPVDVDPPAVGARLVVSRV